MKLLCASLFPAFLTLAAAYAQVINPGGGSGGGGASAWGSITGTLSAQTDLQTALNGKLATAGNAATATSLASTPTICAAGSYTLGIDAFGTSQGCTVAKLGTVTTVGFTGGLFSIANPTTAPAITVAGTSGGIPYFSSASAWASSAAGTVNHVVGWGGAGSAPVDLGALPAVTGGACTNQAVTAISGSAVPTCTTITSAYVDSSIAPTASPTLVTPNLGTPSVLTLTNATGLPHYNTSTTFTGIGPTPFTPASGTAVVYDATATTGNTQLILRDGAAGIAGANGLRLAFQNNGGTLLSAVYAPSSDNVAILSHDGSANANFTAARITGTDRLVLNAANALVSFQASAGSVEFDTASPTGGVKWNGPSQFTNDAGIFRESAGLMQATNGTQGTTAANYRALKLSALISGGTTFTATGLSVGTLVGGASAGTFALGANGPGTVVVTMGNTATAPTGWSCWGSDRSLLTALVDQASATTTTASINIPTGALSGDVISFGCLAY